MSRAAGHHSFGHELIEVRRFPRHDSAMVGADVEHPTSSPTSMFGGRRCCCASFSEAPIKFTPIIEERRRGYQFAAAIKTCEGHESPEADSTLMTRFGCDSREGST